MESETGPKESTGRCATTATHAANMSLIVRLCHELANASSLTAMFDAAVDVLAAGTGFARTAVLTLTPTGAMHFRTWRGISDAYRDRVNGHSPWPADAVDPAAILVDDVASHPVTSGLTEVFRAEKIGALVFLPLVGGGRLLGKFMLYAGEPTDWQRVDLTFARAVADLLASFLLRESTQEQLLQSRKMESLGLLAGGVAHDFNNLLTAMLGYAELLRIDLPKGTPQHTNAEMLLRVATEASELTRQLLDFARPKPMQVEVVDVAALVAESRPMLRRLVGDAIDVAVVGGARPLPVEANRAQLLQVLRNLVTNARDAMPKGGHLTISVQERPSAGGERSVEIAVTDDGIGMDEHVRARIFEPLFTTKREGRGTGLGLSICYGIVSHLRGDITVTSAPGRGSTFVVNLPLATAGLPTPSQPRVTDAPRHPVNVLLVEDQRAVRAAITAGLSAHGCSVTGAGNGREALRALEHGRFDIVVSDIVMPEMDGIELLEQLRRTAPDMPILLITGYAELANELPVHVPLMHKPFTPTELDSRLRELVPAMR